MRGAREMALCGTRISAFFQEHESGRMGCSGIWNRKLSINFIIQLSIQELVS